MAIVSSDTKAKSVFLFSMLLSDITTPPPRLKSRGLFDEVATKIHIAAYHYAWLYQ